MGLADFQRLRFVNATRKFRDLGMFARRPLDQALVRSLVVLKLWQARYFRSGAADAEISGWPGV
jgi:hypothetical protein